MRYTAEFTKPRPFYMTDHTMAWMIVDTHGPTPVGTPTNQIALCANKKVADAIVAALNQGPHTNG